MPLKGYCCKICGKCAPRAYLQHSRYKQRIAWLRRHYKRMHPKAFRRWSK